MKERTKVCAAIDGEGTPSVPIAWGMAQRAAHMSKVATLENVDAFGVTRLCACVQYDTEGEARVAADYLKKAGAKVVVL